MPDATAAAAAPTGTPGALAFHLRGLLGALAL
jgi:hypothetical protein